MNKSKTELEKDHVILPKDPFGYIALWQFLTFIILLLMVWLNELSDFTSVLFKTQSEGANIFRGCVLSAGVFLTAIMTIGNTYIQQKRVLKTLVSVCSNCHRVEVRPNDWRKMEEYVSDNSMLTFSHGLCPVCMADVMHTIEARQAQKKAAAAAVAT